MITDPETVDLVFRSSKTLVFEPVKLDMMTRAFKFSSADLDLHLIGVPGSGNPFRFSESEQKNRNINEKLNRLFAKHLQGPSLGVDFHFALIVASGSIEGADLTEQRTKPLASRVTFRT